MNSAQSVNPVTQIFMAQYLESQFLIHGI